MSNGVRAFLPGSLVDMRPVRTRLPYEGKTPEFKVISSIANAITSSFPAAPFWKPLLTPIAKS